MSFSLQCWIVRNQVINSLKLCELYTEPGRRVSLFLCRIHIHFDPTKFIVCLHHWHFSLENPVSTCSEHHFWSVIWDRKPYRASLGPMLSISARVSFYRKCHIGGRKNELTLDMLLHCPLLQSDIVPSKWKKISHIYLTRSKPFLAKTANILS